MTDNVTANQGYGGPVFQTDEIDGIHTPITKISFGVDGVITTVDEDHPLPAVVSGTVTANTGLSQPITDAQLRASAVPVSGAFYPATQPVSGTVTANTGLSQPLTDTQLRASDVKVSLDGEQVAISNFPATQAVSASALPLPTGAATEETLQYISSISDDLKSVADSLLFVASAMLEKLPRVTGNDQMACSVENSTAISINAGQTIATVTTLGTINAVGGRWANGDNMNQAGVMHLYDNIRVT